MKLYGGMSHLLYKRLVSAKNRASHKIALALKEGDIIHACDGVNHRIKEITPEIFQKKNGWWTVDFLIILDNGGQCSWNHCVLYPTPSAKEVFEDWKRFVEQKREEEWEYGEEVMNIVNLVKQGINPFDDNGILKDEHNLRLKNEDSHS